MRADSLTTRFLLALLLGTALPFLLFGLYLRGEVRQREEQQVLDVYLPRWADDAGRKITASLEDASRAGWYLVKSAETALRNEQADTRAAGIRAFEELVYSLFQRNTDFDMVILADAAGEVLTVTWSPALDAERHDELAALRPARVGEANWFQALRGGDNPETWVPRHLSPFLFRSTAEATRSKDPTRYSLGMAFAVQMRDGRYGALYVLLRWQQVQDVLDGVVRFLRDNAGFSSAEAFLADREGRVLAHSDRARYGINLPPPLRQREVRASTRLVDASGEELGVGMADLRPNFRGFAFDWRVGLHAPVRELFEVSRDFGSWLLLLVPLVTVLLGLFAWLSSRAVVRPLRELAGATRQVAQGDLNTRVPVRGGGELADLSRAFNSMAGDLSESRERLREAERQAAWAEMARQIAHEIKNPLTPMRMSAQMLARARREDDDRWPDLADRLVRNVLQQTEALDRIASDFRQFAGAPARDVQEVEVDAMVAGVADLIAGMTEAAGRSVDFSYGAAGEVLELDVQEMRRVMLNLIHNSLEASAPAGRVSVATSVNGAAVRIQVADDGPGVDPSVQAHLFEPYFTTKSSGTGLGLAICRKIINAHGGQISLESAVAGNTVFCIALPRAESSA